jgi:cytoskeletal protein RodZ
MKQNKRKRNKKWFFITALLVMIIAIAACLVYWHHRITTQAAQKVTTASKAANLNLSPPTKADQKRVDNNKQRIASDKSNVPPSSNSNASTSGNTTTKKTVTPTITFAGVYDQAVQVGSYVGGVVEDGGTCTATFTMGSLSVTKTVRGVANSSSVSCPTFNAQPNEFSQKGTWSVVVSYSSATSTGTSQPQTLEIN